MSLVLSHNIIGDRTGNRDMAGPQMSWGGVSPGCVVGSHATKANQPRTRASTEEILTQLFYLVVDVVC